MPDNNSILGIMAIAIFWTAFTVKYITYRKTHPLKDETVYQRAKNYFPFVILTILTLVVVGRLISELFL